MNTFVRTLAPASVLAIVLATSIPTVVSGQPLTASQPRAETTGKIYSIILKTLDALGAAGVTPGNAGTSGLSGAFGTRLTRFDVSGRIGLNLDVDAVTPDLLDRLSAMGGGIVHAIPEGNLVAVYLPIDRVLDAAALAGVKIVRPITGGVANTGSVTSEGDALHHAADVRTDLDVKGDSVAVGVISDGCVTWAASQALGDLPGAFGPPNFTFANGAKSGASGDEGTAMMEIVHDLAPNSDLYFYGALSLGGSATMIDAIQRLVREKGCRIIVDDLTYFDQPMFEDGTPATAGMIAAAAQWAIDTGVVYVSSAGNWAKGAVTNRSHYQHDFADNNPLSNTPVKPLPAIAIPLPAPPGGYAAPFDNLHDFDPGAAIDAGLKVIVPPFTGGEPPELDVILEWNEAWGASANDFDLYLYDGGLTAIKASSTTLQAGAQNAYEAIAHTNTSPFPETLNVVINLNVPPAVAPRLLGLYIWGCSWVEYNTPENSIWGQPGITDAIAVGAIPYNNLTLFEPFSSRGNYDVYFPLYESRQKPDVAAIDGNAITGTGGFGSWDGANWRFYGTSASAPHVAAMAALVLSQSPAMTPDEVRAKFHRTAVDLGDPGFDAIFGSGRADAEIAMLEVDTSEADSLGPYGHTITEDVPAFLSTADGYAVGTVEVTGGTGQPAAVTTYLSVSPGDPYGGAGVPDPGCPTLDRWYALTQSGGTAGLFDAEVTAYVDETERAGAGIADTNLRLLRWNGAWLESVPQLSPPERVGNTWKVAADLQAADFSPFFVGHLARGFSVSGISGGEGAPDSAVRVEFEVSNTGNAWDTLDCSFTDSRGWTILPADSAISVPAASAETLEIPVMIGGTDTVGTIDTVWMTVRSVSDSTLLDSAFVVVTVGDGTVSVSAGLAAGWSMVSVPVPQDDMSRGALFTGIVSKAYRYEGSYVPEETLATGTGYWVKLADSTTVVFEGPAREEDSVSVRKGWNIIGTISSPVAVGDVGDPGAIVLSAYYGYDAGYSAADSLRPCRSYWVKVSADGKLYLKKE